MLFLTRQRRIFKHSVDFAQIDKEWHWYALLIHFSLVQILCQLLQLIEEKFILSFNKKPKKCKEEGTTYVHFVGIQRALHVCIN